MPGMRSETSPGRRRRRLWLSICVVLGVLAAGYSGYWLVLRAETLAAVDAWAEQRRAEGWQVDLASPHVAGFPAALRVAYSRASLRAPASLGDWIWTGERLELDVDPAAPTHPVARLHGTQTLNLLISGFQQQFTGAAREFGADVSVVDGTSTIRARDLTLRSLRGDTVRIGTASARLRPTGDADLAFNVSAEDVLLPVGTEAALGRRIDAAAIRGSVIGPLPGGPWPAAIWTWRDAGGYVQVDRMRVDYGPLDMAGSGRVSLDRGGQPVGQLNARLSGAGAAVDALRAAGAIRDSDAAGLKVAIAVLKRTPEGGGTPVVDVPVSVRNRTLFVGPAAVLRLPRIQWWRSASM